MMRCLLALLVLSGTPLPVQAEGSRPAGAAAVEGEPHPAPTPLQDDANLNHVHFVGSKIGWAVGDRGVIWRTVDGGTTWSFMSQRADCAWQRCCFLTDRVGWIVGQGTTPFTQIGFGVVLFTSDGGRTWTELAETPLPRLFYVRFFNMREGIAAGDSTAEFPTGVLRTADGGRTWQPVAGPPGEGWRAGDFAHPDAGAVAGQSGRVSLVGDGRMLQPRLEQLGQRSICDVVLSQTPIGWMVGDGAFVMCSKNGGVVWEAAPGALPPEIRNIADFHTVAVHGQQVWIAGQPGTVIWHSSDAGRTWTRQSTGQSVPIYHLEFTSARTGWAAGALGMLLRTDDGGENWRAVRGGNRRVALMTVCDRPGGITAHLLAHQSLEFGYRSVAVLPIRYDSPSEAGAHHDADLRLHAALNTVGGAGGRIDWPLPISAPNLEQHREALLADWMRRTEGRLHDVLLGRLVTAVKTWRPSVVVIDQSTAGDAAVELLNEAVLQAVQAAADPTRLFQRSEQLGLKPWKVHSVFARLPAGSTGNAHVEIHEYLPRVGKSVSAAAAPALALVSGDIAGDSRREAYRRVFASGESVAATAAASGGLFAGIVLQPGGDARRNMLDFDEAGHYRGERIAALQRNFHAYTERLLDDPRHASQVVGQLRQLTADMPAEQAVIQLRQLADEYRRRAEWELVEATYVELVQQYPDQPAAHEAMKWLLQLWTGAEPVWQRVQRTHVSGKQLTVDIDAVRTQIARAAQGSPDVEDSIDPALRPTQSLPEPAGESAADPLQIALASGVLKVGADRDWSSGTVGNWHHQAVRLAALIRKQAPPLYQSPGVQFPLAALLRARQSHRLADRVYRNFAGEQQGSVWQQTAAAELWLLNPLDSAPKVTAPSRPTGEPPFLDGLLSDACWRNAQPLRLSSVAADDDARNIAAAPLIMLAHDSRFLYIAATVPRVPGTPGDGPDLEHRQHDADLSRFDRLSFYFDIDRDYGTYYAFHIDQRGWTAESCWIDSAWNPQWHVLVDADRTHWRLEAAIPWDELVPAAPQPRSYWSVGVVRTVPTIGRQSWTGAAADPPGPESFGLLRFD